MSAEEITNAVAQFMGVAGDDIRQMNGKSRSDSIVIARHAAIGLCREYTHLSLKQIAVFFNLRNHATIISSCRQCENMMETNRAFRRIYMNVQRYLSAGVDERELMSEFYPFIYLNNMV